MLALSQGRGGMRVPGWPNPGEELFAVPGPQTEVRAGGAGEGGGAEQGGGAQEEAGEEIPVGGGLRRRGRGGPHGRGPQVGEGGEGDAG